MAACPVPPEQRPLNEFRELQESRFFRWGTLAIGDYGQKLLWTWGWAWLIAGPVAAASFPPTRHPALFFMAGASGATFFLTLVLIRLYVGWAHIGQRLSNTRIPYEESGWYDGQIWDKPTDVQMQDNLVLTYEVRPILKRIQVTLVVLGVLLISSGVFWAIVP